MDFLELSNKNKIKRLSSQTDTIENISKNTIVLLGDSITELNGKGDDIINSEPIYYSHLATGYFTWANVLLNQKLNLVKNLGVGGNTTAQILARVQDVIDLKPAYCIVLGGTNDAVANWDTATTKANLLGIYQSLINAGIIVVAMTIPPRDDLSDTLKTQLIECNNYIRGLRSIIKNYMVCDVYDTLVDVADNNYANDLSSDGVHPSCQGAYNMGLKLYDIFDKIIPDISVFSGGNLDADNPFANPYLLGGATTATSWSINSSAIYTESKIARNNGLEWQQFDITSVGADRVQLFQDITSGFAVGDSVYAYIEYEIDDSATLIDRYMAYMSAVDSEFSQQAVGFGMFIADSGGIRFPQSITKGVIKTPRFTIPETSTRLQLWISCNLKGRFRIGRTRVIKA